MKSGMPIVFMLLPLLTVSVIFAKTLLLRP